MKVDVEPLVARNDPPSNHIGIFPPSDEEVRRTSCHDVVGLALSVAQNKSWDFHGELLDERSSVAYRASKDKVYQL